MEPRQILRSGITASAIVHLSFLLLVIFFTEVHPFSPVATEPIAVDLVTPEEAKEKTPEPQPSPSPTPQIQIPPSSDSAIDQSPKSGTAGKAASSQAASSAAPSSSSASNPAPSNSPASNPTPSNATSPTPQPASTSPATPQQAATPPQKQAASSPLSADRQTPAAQPAAPAAAMTQAAAPPGPPPPAYVPAQPDLSIKYNVLLGLPVDRPGDGFDAAATQAADVGSSPIAEFRRHLKTCSTLPKTIAPTDKLSVKLRVMMTPDGKLAAQPIPIEGSASPKALGLMQSAISALQACQPYAMLPADRYGEWKVLDLSFTPQDFRGG